MGPSPTEIARSIAAAFADYNAEFRAITRRAPQRFEARDWRGSQRDAVERIELYDRFVKATAEQVKVDLGEPARDAAFWRASKATFTALIEELPDSEFTKTFFSSVTRRLFGTVGVNPEIEYIALDLDPLARITSHVVTNTYTNRGSLALLFEEVLTDFRFRTPYRDFERSVAHVSEEVAAYISAVNERRMVLGVDIIRPVFFQQTRAYLVGRINGRGWQLPLVIALKNTERGVLVDAVMLAESDVSIVFSFTRSYFHVDLERVGEAVLFLKSILPRKAVSELFTVLGRAKQGKTERYRELFRHLQQTDDDFVHAPGERGLVMVCFTLPSFDVVFKIIRDRFPPSKNVLREEVRAKYELVFKHDRAGTARRRAGIPTPEISAQPLRARAPRGAGRRNRGLRARRRRGSDLRSPVHRTAHDAAQSLPARGHARGLRTRGARLRPGHPRPRLQQHLCRRSAAEELRRHASRPRDLLRLRRALSGHRLPLSGFA